MLTGFPQYLEILVSLRAKIKALQVLADKNKEKWNIGSAWILSFKVLGFYFFCAQLIDFNIKVSFFNCCSRSL